MENNPSPRLNPYPFTWGSYETLRDSREQAWEALPRKALTPERQARTGYKDPHMGVYYFEKTHFRVLEMEKQTLKENKASTKRFFNMHSRFVGAEFSCYKYGDKIGFDMPEKVSLATKFSHEKDSENNIRLKFESGLAVSEVKGITVEEYLNDRKIDPAEKARLRERAQIESLAAGLVFGEYDRNPSNMILSDNKLVNIDFEYACRSTPREINEEWEFVYGEVTPITILKPVQSRLQLAEMLLENAQEIQGYPKNTLQKNITAGMKYLGDVMG